MEKFVAEKAEKMLALNNEIGTIKLDIEKVKDEINHYKSKAEEASEKEREKRSQLSQIIMAVNNIYEKCSDKDQRLTTKSALRKVSESHGFKPEAGKGKFDNFERSTELSKLHLEVIKAYLEDHKKTYLKLEENAETSKFIRDKRDKNELSKALANKLNQAIKEEKKRNRKLPEKKEDK